MAAVDSLDGAAGRSVADVIGGGALKAASVIWFLAAVGGQGLFAAYIFAAYAASPAVGQFEAWTKRLHDGDLTGNASSRNPARTPSAYAGK